MTTDRRCQSHRYCKGRHYSRSHCILYRASAAIKGFRKGPLWVSSRHPNDHEVCQLCASNGRPTWVHGRRRCGDAFCARRTILSSKPLRSANHRKLHRRTRSAAPGPPTATTSGATRLSWFSTCQRMFLRSLTRLAPQMRVENVVAIHCRSQCERKGGSNCGLC
jgi:hypothetical protein